MYEIHGSARVKKSRASKSRIKKSHDFNTPAHTPEQKLARASHPEHSVSRTENAITKDVTTVCDVHYVKLAS